MSDHGESVGGEGYSIVLPDPNPTMATYGCERTKRFEGAGWRKARLEFCVKVRDADGWVTRVDYSACSALVHYRLPA